MPVCLCMCRFGLCVLEASASAEAFCALITFSWKSNQKGIKVSVRLNFWLCVWVWECVVSSACVRVLTLCFCFHCSCASPGCTRTMNVGSCCCCYLVISLPSSPFIIIFLFDFKSGGRVILCSRWLCCCCCLLLFLTHCALLFVVLFVTLEFWVIYVCNVVFLRIISFLVLTTTLSHRNGQVNRVRKKIWLLQLQRRRRQGLQRRRRRWSGLVTVVLCLLLL